MTTLDTTLKAKWNSLLGYFYVAGGATLFSTKAIFIKLAYMDKADAPLMLALRMVFSLPFYLVVVAWALRRNKIEGRAPIAPKTWASALLVGLVGYYVSSMLDFSSLVYISAQLERLALFTYPVIVMVLAWAFMGQRIRWQGALGAAITYGGLIVVFASAKSLGSSNVTYGTLLVLGCAFTFATYTLLAKKLVGEMGASLFTGVALTGSSIGCIAHYVIVSGGVSVDAPPRFLWLAFGCAIFATVLPSFMQNAGLSRVSAQTSAMIGSISPLVTIGLSVAVLGEAFTLADAIGSLLVIAGIVLFAMTDKKPAPAPATA